MTLKIAKAGRAILPKPVRDRVGLHAGSDLDMQETPDGVVLKPARQMQSATQLGPHFARDICNAPDPLFTGLP